MSRDGDHERTLERYEAYETGDDADKSEYREYRLIASRQALHKRTHPSNRIKTSVRRSIFVYTGEPGVHRGL